VQYWCLGNEMDGPWQLGRLSSGDYAVKAREAAKMMRLQDPSLKLVLCGSSNTKIPIYPEWDRVVLETCWEYVDYLALHYYATNYEDDTASYLAMAAQFEAHLDTLAGLLHFAKTKLRSKHNVYLSWHEWNVWYKDTSGNGQWQEAPHSHLSDFDIFGVGLATDGLSVLLGWILYATDEAWAEDARSLLATLADENAQNSP
jgi:alpha-L-arabinofuranosidase